MLVFHCRISVVNQENKGIILPKYTESMFDIDTVLTQLKLSIGNQIYLYVVGVCQKLLDITN